MSSHRPEHDPVVRADAWIGDAVLALYVREFLLAECHGHIDGETFVQLTSNDFLRLVGNATEVEACIGRAYREGQLPLAYDWIRRELHPKMLVRLHSLRSARQRA